MTEHKITSGPGFVDKAKLLVLRCLVDKALAANREEFLPAGVVAFIKEYIGNASQAEGLYLLTCLGHHDKAMPLLLQFIGRFVNEAIVPAVKEWEQTDHPQLTKDDANNMRYLQALAAQEATIVNDLIACKVCFDPPLQDLAEDALSAKLGQPRFRGTEDQEQLQLPPNIISIIDEVANDIAELRIAFDDVAAHQYTKAVEDLLQLLEHIVVDLILPKVKVQQD